MVGPEVGEGAGVLGHSDDADCLEYWVQGCVTLWGPLGDPPQAYMSPILSAGSPRRSGRLPAPH